MAEERLSETDICDVVVCQYAPSWTAVYNAGNAFTTCF